MGTSAHTLRFVRDAFGLSNAEIGGMFGESDREIGTWFMNDWVPSEHCGKLSVVFKVAVVLNYRVKNGALPAVVRRQASAYGGKSVLELITDDRHEWLLEDVESAFDYSSVA